MASDLAPGFLVATPNLVDPNFARAVVLLVDHREEGSLGFIVNRPADIDFSNVVDELDLPGRPETAPAVPVMVGGPVSPHTGWIVYEQDHALVASLDDGTIEVTPSLRVSASRERLDELARTPMARSHMLVLGYAGWGAGQLDEEIRQGAWVPVSLDEQVIFRTPVEERWQAALTQAGIDPRQLVGSAFGGPPN
ncbi:MAG: YqgE/AlgH family protein [Myxococcota bacterium]